MLPWMSCRSRAIAIAPSPLEGTRKRLFGLRQQAPEFEELVLEKTRRHGLGVRHERGEGHLQLYPAQDVADSRIGLIAEIQRSLDLPPAQIAGELFRGVLAGQLAWRLEGKGLAMAEHVADLLGRLLRQAAGKIRHVLSIEVAHDHQIGRAQAVLSGGIAFERQAVDDDEAEKVNDRRA